MEWYGYVLLVAGLLIVAFIFFLIGMLYRKKVAEREIGSAETEATRIINEAIKGGENKKREMLVEAKEEIHKSRTEYEKEVKERRADLQKQERRLQQKEESLDKKLDAFERKEDDLRRRQANIAATQDEVEMIKKSQLETLEKLSGLTQEEAKNHLLKNLENECKHRRRAQDQGDRDEPQGQRRSARPRDHLHRHPALRRRPRRRNDCLRRRSAER